MVAAPQALLNLPRAPEGRQGHPVPVPGRARCPAPGAQCLLNRPNASGRYEEYHPYGSTAWWAEKNAIGVSQKRYRYTGMERDSETGLERHGVRYLAPWLGRWTSADPSGMADGPNRYAFVRGNPVRFSDRSGLAGDDPVEVVIPTEIHTKPSVSLILERVPIPEAAPAQLGTPEADKLIQQRIQIGELERPEDVLSQGDESGVVDAGTPFAIQLPKFGPGATDILGPQLAATVEQQIGTILLSTVQGVRAAGTVSQTDLGHFHVEVPGSDPQAVAALRQANRQLGAAALPALSESSTIGRAGRLPHAEARIRGSESTLAQATRQFFRDVSQIRGSIFLFHSFEGGGLPSGHPARTHPFPISSQQRLELPMDRSGMFPAEFSLGEASAPGSAETLFFEFSFFRAGNVDPAQGGLFPLVITPSLHSF